MPNPRASVLMSEYLDKFIGLHKNGVFDIAESRFMINRLAQRTYRKELLPRVRKFDTVYNKAEVLSNILHVNTLDSQGGAAKVAYRLSKALNGRKYGSRMLVNIAFSDEDGIDVILRDNSTKQELLWKAQGENGWLDFFHLSSFQIKNLDSFKKTDILHLHNLHGDYFSPFALPELTALKKTVWTLHDMQAITGHCAHSFDCDRWLTGCESCLSLSVHPGIGRDTTAFLWKTKKAIYECSNLTVVCPSKWLKEEAEKSILQDKDIRLIYNGIDQSVFVKIEKNQARKELNLPLDKKILLFSACEGANNYWKGGQYLSEAYREIGNREDILFLNVGGSVAGYDCDNWRANWLDVPYVSDEKDMALLYSAADLFIYPSLADNCPLVVLESLSCGTPVIAFNVGGIPELVKHLKTGYIAAYKNLEDFVKGILLFVQNPDLADGACSEAYLLAKKDFSLEKMVDEYLKLYKEVHGFIDQETIKQS